MIFNSFLNFWFAMLFYKANHKALHSFNLVLFYNRRLDIEIKQYVTSIKSTDDHI